MKSILKHEDARDLENLVCTAYHCERFGVMGVANADYLETYPLHAALLIFAPLYKSTQEVPEIDKFISYYKTVFEYPKENMQDYDTVINEYITTLKKLIEKYCQ